MRIRNGTFPGPFCVFNFQENSGPSGVFGSQHPCREPLLYPFVGFFSFEHHENPSKETFVREQEDKKKKEKETMKMENENRKISLRNENETEKRKNNNGK